MPQEPIYDSITFNELGKPLTETVKIENKTDIISEDVKNVLCVSAVSTILDTDAYDGKLGFGGKVAFSIVYELVSGELKKLECGLEFSGAIVDESITAKTENIISSEIVKTEYSLSGTRLTISAVILVTATPSKTQEITALTGGDGLVLNNGEITAWKSYGIKKESYPIEEEFILNYQVEEVLSHTAKPIITAVQCGVGCIIIDGEVFLSALLLQNTEKSDIIRENKTIPFRVEVPYEEAMPTLHATAYVDIKSFKTDITVDEENNKSTVLASVILQFTSCAYTEQTETVVQDVFSTQVNLDVTKDTVYSCCQKSLISCQERVNVKSTIQELPAGVRLMSIGNESFEIVSSEKAGDKISVNGVISYLAFTRDSDGINGVVRVETPVECSLATNALSDDYSLRVTCANINGRLVSLDTIETEIELIFTVYVQSRCKLEYINGITERGAKQEISAGISVYIAIEGEDMWSLAKRLNVCPEDVKQTNKDLTYPLTSDERIVVYRQK